MQEERFHLEFVIPNTIYPCSIAVSIGNNKEQVLEWMETQAGLEEQLKYFKAEPSSLDNADGGVLMRGGTVFMHLLHFPLKPKHRGDLSHELLHVVCDVFRYIGMPHSESSEEAYAYYIDYLTKYVYTQLDEYYDANSERIKRLTETVS